MSNLPSEYTLPPVRIGGRYTETPRDVMLQCAHELADKVASEDYPTNSPEWQDKLILEAIKWDSSIDDPKINLFIKRYFWVEIQRLTGVDMEYVYDILETQHRERKQEKHDKLFIEGLLSALDQVQEDGLEATKLKLSKLIQAADSVASERPLQPIISFSDYLPELREDLASTQGQKYTGLVQQSIPELDDATGGFQGLNLISAKSGEGKTILLNQCMMDVLTHQKNTCVLFLSLDMTQKRIARRLVSNRARMSINAVRGATTPDGWTESEKVRIEQAMDELNDLGKRLRILDRFNFPDARRYNILCEMERLKRETDTEHCLLGLDYLNLLETPEGFIQMEKDDWLADEIRIIADYMNEDPVLAIAESRKNDGAEKKGTSDNIKGSHRIVMRADCIIMLNAFDDDKICTEFTISPSGYVERRLVTDGEYEEKDAKKRAKLAERIRAALAKRGEAAITLKIDKARDGATKTDINVINHFIEYAFTPFNR